MIKKIYFLVLIILLSTFVSADIIIQPSKTEYIAGETFQAEISLYETPLETLKPSNFFLVNNNSDEIKVGLILTEISPEEYYVYFNIPANLESGNYQFTVKNVLYKVNNVLTKKEAFSSINIIKNSSEEIITIIPALLKLNLSSQDTLKIRLTNNNDKDILVSTSNSHPFVYPIRSLLTVPKLGHIDLQIRTDNSKIKEEEKAFIILNYSSNEYSVPVFIYRAKKIENISDNNITVISDNNTTNTSDENKTVETPIIDNPIEFLTSLDEVKKTIDSRTTLSGELKVKNNLNSRLNNISIYLTGSLDKVIAVEPSFISSISSNSTIPVNVIINKDKDVSLGNYTGLLKLSTPENYSDSLRFIIEIITEEKDIPEDIDFDQPFEETNYTELYNVTQTTKKEGFNTGWVILIFIILFITGIFLLILKINRGMQKQKPFENLLKNRKI